MAVNQERGPHANGTNPIILLPGQPEVDDANLTVHTNVYCDGPAAYCRSGRYPIKGVRFKCTVCQNVDYCRACLGASDNPHDRSHAVFRCVSECQFVSLGQRDEDAKRTTLQDMKKALPEATFRHITMDDLKLQESGDSRMVSRDVDVEGERLVDTKESSSRIETVGERPSQPHIEEYSIKEDGHVEKHFRPILGPGTPQSQARGETTEDVIFVQDLFTSGRMAQRYDYRTQSEFYELLRASQPATRVIELAPGSGSDKLRCTFEVVNLNQPPRYEALSYTWHRTADDWPANDAWSTQRDEEYRSTGRWNFQVPMFVNNDWWIPISSGLRDALRALRHPQTSRTLWVDQLCIDQRSIQEREIQVTYMSHVYSRAHKVLLWVGEEDRLSEQAFSVMESFEKCLDSRPAASLPNLKTLNQTQAFAGVPDLTADSGAWKGVYDLFKRPVFSRGWVVQEVTRGREVVIRCGQHEISWETVSNMALQLWKAGQLPLLLDTFIDRQKDTFDDIPRLDSIVSMTKSRHQFWRGRSVTTLYDALHTTRAFSVSVPHDKIYIAIGLREPVFDIRPRYEETFVNVCIATTKWILEHEKNFSICTFNPRPDSTDPQTPDHPAWPSWVPNFADKVLLPISLADFSYNASGDSVLSVSWPVEGNPVLMEVPSHRCDTVELVAPLPPQNMGPIVRLLGFASFTRALGSQYRGGLATADVFLRTCHLNNMLDSHIPLEHSISVLASWFSRSMRMLAVDDDEFAEELNGSPLYLDIIKMATVEPGPTQSTIEDIEHDAAKMSDPTIAHFGAVTADRAMFITRDGYLGLGPPTVAPGDEVHVIPGGRTPFVLRERPDSGGGASDASTMRDVIEYSLIGEAYVHGLMYGEVVGTEGMEWGTIRIY